MKNKIFEENPNLDFYFETTDGSCFYTEQDALCHSKKLDDRKVLLVRRLEIVETQQSEGEGQDAKVETQESEGEGQVTSDATKGCACGNDLTLGDAAEGIKEIELDTDPTEEDDDAAAMLEKSIKNFLELDLNAAPYGVLVGLVKTFGLQCLDRKSATIIEVLTQYKETLDGKN